MKQSQFLNILRTLLLLCAFVFFPTSIVLAAGSLSVQSISPGTTVAVGVTFSLSVVPSGFTEPTFIIDDSFGGSTLSSSNINSSGGLYWAPTLSDIGTHSFTITAGDSLGNSASTLQTITVTLPTLTLSAPAPGSILNAGSTLTFSSSVPGLPNPTWSVSDSFAGTISSANINAGGYFNWVPSASDVGNHTIIVSARDNNGRTVSASQAIVVNPAPSVAIATFPSETSFAPGQQVAFTITTTSISSPTFSIRDSFTPSTIGNQNLTSAGSFSWLPTTDSIGRHALGITITDGTNGQTFGITHVVNVQALSVAIQGLSQSYVYPGAPVSFSIIPKGFATATYALADSFSGSTATNANITSSGNFYWVPATADSGIHLFNFTVSDPLGHSASTTQSLEVRGPSVTIQSLSPISTTTTMTSLVAGYGLSFTLTTSGFTSPTFAVADTFSGATSLLPSHLSSAGYLYWIPKVNDVGTHILKITATDSLGHSANTSLRVVVSAINALSGITPTMATPPAITPSATGHIFTTYLGPGSVGTEVTALQNALLKAGFFSGTPGDTYGPLTTAAVKKFQIAKGLEAVGFVGVGTRAALNGGVSAAPITTAPTPLSPVTQHTYKFTTNLALGSVGTAVSELQKRLKEAGVYTGPINGSFGPMTKAGVMKYQAKKGISQLGGVGPSTRAALNAE